MAPLLVHLIFHPASSDARQLAVDLHRALNDDPALPGLRVPTVILAEDGTNLPPPTHDLNEAEHSVVVALIDDAMVVEQVVPADRRSWADFVADLADRCQKDGHRFVPVQLSEAAWPLHDRFLQTNFLRAFGQDRATRYSWLERRIVIEMCRFLEGLGRGTKAPIQVFLSHAKRDIDAEPKVFQTLIEHLVATQPVEAWIDSGKIETGSDFGQAIEDGVRGSAVLVLLTTHYSSRTWCRREILTAKAAYRPVVVVDALQGLELRSFPYLGNVPVMAWAAGGAARAVDLLLKEWLRHLHVTRLLKDSQLPDDCVLPSSPELATVVRLPAERKIFYPDPPLGDEELEVLAQLGRRPETPLQRASQDRTLSQRIIALSISESDSPERYGVLREHLDAALLEISRHLLVRGASLAYGGHLGPDGYTTALFELVRAHQSMSGMPPVERIKNYVGWPTPLPSDATLRYLARFIRVPRPDGVEALEPATFTTDPAFFPPSSAARRYAWARGMTAMRETQTKEVRARIALGGKIGPTATATPLPTGGRQVSWYSGRIPGVVEEVLLSMRAGQPVYLCGAFGGATTLVTQLLDGNVPKEFTWEFQRQAPYSDEMRALYQTQGIPWWDYAEMAAFCAQTGVAGLSKANGLSDAENRELFRSRDLPRIVTLLLSGLQRILAAPEVATAKPQS
jgi:hypothetical protein